MRSSAQREPLPIAPWTVTFSGEQRLPVGEADGYMRGDSSSGKGQHLVPTGCPRST
jgi:hypothetical protein